jgi:hypothetical protein
MTRIVLLAAVLVGFALPAWAFHCPADMAKIDAALQTAQLSAADRAKVVELRQRGGEQHAAGQHQESIDTLAEAMAILGI